MLSAAPKFSRSIFRRKGIMAAAVSRSGHLSAPNTDPRKSFDLQPSSSLLTQLELQYGDELFNFTRGRFICDAEFEMSQRKVHFNVHELGRCAAEAIGARSCVNIEKYPDGMYNKSMLLTMDTGAQVVAKVPNPNAGLPHFTTASEVATHGFCKIDLTSPRSG